MTRDLTMRSNAAASEGAVDHTHEAFDLLASGVPLSLLIDLARATDSREIYSSEPGAADWLRPVAA